LKFQVVERFDFNAKAQRCGDAKKEMAMPAWERRRPAGVLAMDEPARRQRSQENRAESVKSQVFIVFR
jgi:hypothetical protein